VTIVEKLHQEFSDLSEFLGDAGEISFRASADGTFRKALLLAAASYFEVRLTEILIEFSHVVSNRNETLTSFLRNKALKRQYHTLFNWEANNANAFFGLFGEDFKNSAVAQVAQDAGLDQAIKAFLEVGRERNRLVHQDFGTFTLEKTSDEIFALYKSGERFIAWISSQLIPAE
jgi:hypothetical protein